MTVEIIKGLKKETGWSYRRLCRQTGVSFYSMLRWKERLQANEPPVRRPGPGKGGDCNRHELIGKVKKLKHCRKLTRGSGELYRKYEGAVSRREFQHMVGKERQEAFRRMRRVEWNVPGLAWTMDDTGRRGLPVGFQMRINQVRDLSSRKGLSATADEALLSDEEVAEVLEMLFKRDGAPLIGKRDNGSNLNGGPVNELFDAYGVIALNSPPHCARYNGFMEWSQRELKRAMAALLVDTDPDMELVQQAANYALEECNMRLRPCLAGQNANTIFEARHEAMRVYTLQRRKEINEEIKELAMKIMAKTNGSDRLTEQAAWRIAVETWLRREGLITIRVDGKVLPYYNPLLVS